MPETRPRPPSTAASRARQPTPSVPAPPLPGRRTRAARHASPRVARFAGLALAVLAAACSSTRPEDDAGLPVAPRPAPTLAATSSLDWTSTSEIRFSGELVGYLVEVLEVPGGVPDRRPFKPGTVLIQDTKLEMIGFISPGGTTYRFDEGGEAKAVGFGSRNAAIASFFRKGGTPQLVPVVPAPPRG